MAKAKVTPPKTVDALVEEFEQGYGHAGMRSRCKICDSDHWELVDILLARGAGPESIAQFLMDKFGFATSGAPIERHKKQRHAENYEEDR